MPTVAPGWTVKDVAAHLLDGAANNFAFAMRDALTRDQDRLFLALLWPAPAADP